MGHKVEITGEKTEAYHAGAFGDRLGMLSQHVSRADEWAQEHFRRFPNVSSITVDIGVAFAVQFSVMVTWNRPTK